jgi:hypothetical protein
MGREKTNVDVKHLRAGNYRKHGKIPGLGLDELCVFTLKVSQSELCASIGSDKQQCVNKHDRCGPDGDKYY